MDVFTKALGPVFIAGFAVQQFLEILTSVLNLDSSATFAKYKKAILGVASLALGFYFAKHVEGIRVLHALQVSGDRDGTDIG
jgi:hypothetical protein